MRGYNYTGACTGHTHTNRKMQTHKNVWFKNTSHGAERSSQVHFIPFALLLPIAVGFLNFFPHTHNTGRRKAWKITFRQKCCPISSTLLSGATNTSAVWNLKKQFSVSAPPFPSIVLKNERSFKSNLVLLPPIHPCVYVCVYINIDRSTHISANFTTLNLCLYCTTPSRTKKIAV